MTGHAKETKALWDVFDPAIQIAPRTDNREPTPQYISDPHQLPDLCPICCEGFIGPNGCSNGCDD